MLNGKYFELKGLGVEQVMDELLGVAPNDGKGIFLQLTENEELPLRLKVAQSESTIGDYIFELLVKALNKKTGTQTDGLSFNYNDSSRVFSTK